MFRFIKYLFPLFLILIIVYAYFWMKGFEYRKTDPSIAVTESCLLFLETSGFQSLLTYVIEDNLMWNDLKNIPEISDTDSLLLHLSELLENDPQIKGLSGGKIVVAINLIPPDNPVLVLIAQQTRMISDKNLVSALTSSGRMEVINRRKVAGTTVFDVASTAGSVVHNFSIALKKGLLICSFSADQVERTIYALEKEGRTEPVHNYRKLIMTMAENVPANIYIKFSMLDTLLTAFQSYPAGFASSGGYDIVPGTDFLSLNGFISFEDTMNQALEIIKDEIPSEMTLHDFIPASAILLLQLHFNDISTFFEKQSAYKIWKPDKKKLDEITRVHSIDILNFFREMAGSEFGLAVLNINDRPSHFFITEVKRGSDAEAMFKKWLSDFATSGNANISDYHHYRKIDHLKGIDVYQLPLGGIPETIYGKIFSKVSGDFFSVYMNYLIFGNSAEEVAEFTYQIMLGRNITGTENYKGIQDNLLSRSNLFVYINPYKSAGLFGEIMKMSTLNFIQEHSVILEKFSPLTVQINPAGDMFYSRVFLNYSEDINNHVNTVWMSRLDSIIINKPAIVTNHINGAKEIMVQDAKHHLYLISNAGRILWKIPLDGPVMSEIHQIDYYRNSRLQYLFNTKSRIYLIDRNGNPVDKYPVTLRSPATNGLSLFDYEKDGNLRICIACRNRQLYMYEKEGRIVPGWKPSLTDHIVEKPVQHFRVGNRDFIIAADKFKTYILDRQGKVRINPSRQYPVSQNNPFYFDMSMGREKARLISTDTIGNILYIYLSGNSVLVKKEKTDSDHFFILSDINGNGHSEYIYSSDNKIRVTAGTGELLFEKEFNNNITHKPVIYEFSRNDRKIGISIESEEKIYLINADGSFYKGFPLKGSTLFSISSFPDLKGRFNLIVGNKDNFLYNYSVQ